VVVYLLQAAAMGLVGATAGAALGALLQRVFPVVLKSFIPIPISNAIAWEPILRGMLIGFGICVLFALPALLRFRHVSPLLILRGSDNGARKRRFDPVVAIVYGLMAASVTAFAIAQTDSWKRGVIFAGVLAVAIAIFAGMSQLLIVLVRKFFPHGWSFALRPGARESLPTEQPHTAADGLARARHFPAPESLPHPRRPLVAVPLARPQRPAEHLPVRHPT
jgi:putative ABC transport system permease protein